MKLIIYNIIIRLYVFAIGCASLLNAKAGLWVKGRKDWRERLKNHLKTNRPVSGQPVVWMHASSLGEFEQGRPLLEKIALQSPKPYIVLSFFSPSGYEVQKDYAGADWIGYLPADTHSNAHDFVSLLNPSVVFWVKYEYWFHHLQQLYQRKVPVLLISGIFLPRHPFFAWHGAMHRQMLHFFRHFFVQNQSSAQLLSHLVGMQKITVSGDTRFDRVLEISGNWKPIPKVDGWLQESDKVVVAGSTWPEDEKELAHYIQANPNLRWIIAPHIITENSLADTRRLIPDSIKFSELDENGNPGNNRVLLIDNVGMLSRLYKYGTLCFVGGGFSATGLHNVLEAAVYGKPVVFGPDFDDYAEAIGLVEAGGGFTAETALELEDIFNKLLNQDALRQAAGEASTQFVAHHAGATQAIIAFIYANRLLTN